MKKMIALLIIGILLTTSVALAQDEPITIQSMTELEDIQQKLDQLPPDNAYMKYVKANFEKVGKAINFLKNEIDGFIKKDEEYEYYVQTGNEGKIEREGLTEYTMHNATTGEDVPLTGNKVGRVVDYLFDHLQQLFHLELNAKKPELVMPYVKAELETYVKYAIDNFFDALQTDQLEKFLKFMEKPGGCMEDQTKNLIAFQEKNGLKEEVPENNRVADIPLDRVAHHDKTTLFSDCIFQEIDEIDAKNEVNNVAEFKEWKQYEKTIKEKLVGIERPMVTASKNEKDEWVFTPVLDENNRPVIKKITAEDLDRIGPACVEFVAVDL